MMIATVKKIIPNAWKHKIKGKVRKIFTGFEQTPDFAFSSCGEDRILSYLFLSQNTGVYVDVGAFEPIMASNTHLFYLRGWRGINIDACPGSMKKFDELRPGDINLELGISDNEGVLPYYQIDGSHSLMNGFSPQFHDYLKIEKHRIKEINVKTDTLRNVLDKYLPAGSPIGFLLIDVEGLELRVLKSNDWKKYRPVVVMTENHAALSGEIFNNEIVLFMASVNYKLITKTPNEIFFLEGTHTLSNIGTIAF
jgi:FkbM family methyltransferase